MAMPDIVGVDDLLIGQIVGVVEHQHADVAAGEGQDQCVAVRPHHITAYAHTGAKQRPLAQIGFCS